jgi:hypothetical protein
LFLLNSKTEDARAGLFGHDTIIASLHELPFLGGEKSYCMG